MRGRVRAFLVLLVAGGLLLGMPTAVSAQFCMSDDELREYLTEVVIFRSGLAAQICSVNHRKEAPAWSPIIEDFASEARRTRGEGRDIALLPFKRAFDERAEIMLRVQLETVTTPFRKNAKEFSKGRCASQIEAMKLMRGAIRETISSEIRLYVDRERQLVPKCG
jgi:hypothetical protein